MLLDDPKKALQPSLSFTTLGNSSQDTLAWQHILLDRAAASSRGRLSNTPLLLPPTTALEAKLSLRRLVRSCTWSTT
jgi:hypothetical protein